jgi:hypothetical protein
MAKYKTQKPFKVVFGASDNADIDCNELEMTATVSAWLEIDSCEKGISVVCLGVEVWGAGCEISELLSDDLKERIEQHVCGIEEQTRVRSAKAIAEDHACDKVTAEHENRD